MSRRLASLLAEAKLADRDVALARARAGRDAQNFASVADALKSLVPAAGKAVDMYGNAVGEEAMQGAEQLAAENANTIGDDSETPEQMAKRLAFTDKRIAAPEKTGDTIKDFLADPLGYKARAAKAAQTAAEQKIVAGVHGSRDKQAALDLAAQQAAQAREDKQNSDEAARAEREQARMDAADAATTARVDREHESEANRALQLQLEQMREAAALEAAKAKAKKAGGGNSAVPPGFQADKQTIKKAQEVRRSSQDAIDEANHILAQLDDPNISKMVGPVVGRYYKAKGDLGFKSDATGMRADLGNAFNAYKHAITGAAMTVKEAPDIVKVAPNDIDEDPANIRAKLKAGIAHAQRQMALADAVLGTGDVRATPADAGTAPNAPAQHGASGGWSAPAAKVNVVDAAHAYRTMSAPQQAKVRALIAQGVDRVAAVVQVAQGG